MAWEDDDFDVDALLSGSDGEDDDKKDSSVNEDSAPSSGKSKFLEEEEADAAAIAAEEKARLEKEKENALLRAALPEGKIGGKRAERIAQKEKEERERVRALKEGEEGDGMTAAERQRAVEDADFENTEDLFGGLADALSTKNPKSEADFEELAAQLSRKLSVHAKSRHFGLFVKSLVRGCADGLDPVELRDISSAIQTLANTKTAEMQKGKGKKKGKVRVNIKMERGTADEDDGVFCLPCAFCVFVFLFSLPFFLSPFFPFHFPPPGGLVSLFLRPSSVLAPSRRFFFSIPLNFSNFLPPKLERMLTAISFFSPRAHVLLTYPKVSERASRPRKAGTRTRTTSTSCKIDLLKKCPQAALRQPVFCALLSIASSSDQVISASDLSARRTSFAFVGVFLLSVGGQKLFRDTKDSQWGSRGVLGLVPE
jgi:Translation initiation factor eIF3 subunit